MIDKLRTKFKQKGESLKQIFINSLKFMNLIILALILSSCDDNKSHLTVTADTKIDPNSEISKYVTQDEYR